MASYECKITDGIKELVVLAEYMSSTKADARNYEQMQRHGKCALEKMEAAKQMLEDQKSASSSQTEDMVEKKRKLNDEEKEQERKLYELEIQKEHHNQVYSLLQGKLHQAEGHLAELLALQKKAKKEENCSKILTTVSLVLLPVFTFLFSMEFFQRALKLTDTKQLFASATVLTIIFQVSMYVAQKAVLELQKTISQYKVQVSDHTHELYRCDKDRREIEEKIKNIKDSLENIKGRISELAKSSTAESQHTNELYNCIEFVNNLIQKINGVVPYLDDPLDFKNACSHLDQIYQLVLSEIEKGKQGSLGFLDTEKVEIKKLKCGTEA